MSNANADRDPIVQGAIQQTLQAAFRHHQAGRLAQAEALYRQVLEQNPGQVDALLMLGMVAFQTQRHDLAVDLIGQAVILQPGNPQAHYNLGVALGGKGRLEEAVAAFRQAIALQPNYLEALYNLGVALRRKGDLDAAIAAFQRTIALNPKVPEAHNNLGEALTDKGQMGEAAAACRQAIVLRPNFPEALNNLGNALKGQGLLDEAITAYRRAIALQPNYAEAHSNLGTALRAQGRLDDAAAAHRRAVALTPKHAGAYTNLGNTLRDQGLLDDAIAAHRQAIALQLNYAEAHYNLGIALKDEGQLDEAVAAYRQAIALKPGYAEAYANLGNVLREQGQPEEAITAYRQAVALNPASPEASGSLAYGMYFHPDYNAGAIAEELRRWNLQHAEPLKKWHQPFANSRDPQRRLRIGYVSSDFHFHASAHFLMPLLRAHDHTQFEVFCYAQVARPDEWTTRFQSLSQGGRNTVGISDEALAAQIRRDGIDILVDLKLHTDQNRLLVFARKPAPVQVTWLGYPGSTGLTAIDYRLSDPYLDPPEADVSVYSERTIRLPDTFWCYDPLDEIDMPVNALPARERGVITFGCLNGFWKVNDGLLAIFAQVLREVEGSRFMLLAPAGSHRQSTLDLLAREGIAPGRVEFLARMPRREYLAQYQRIDLGLDSFPCNGHTTSLDSFWMGVPVVTRIGPTAMGRAGLSQLSNLGLAELAGRSAEEFVRIAVGLAKDLPRLQQLRAALRQRMEASPLMDGPRFARNVEAAFRQIWRTWCATVGGK